MSECTLEIPGGETMTLRTPYCDRLVDDLKTEVPLHARAWDSDRKAWEIAGDYRELIEHLVLKHFPSLQVLTETEDYLVDRLGRAAQSRLF